MAVMQFVFIHFIVIYTGTNACAIFAYGVIKTDDAATPRPVMESNA